jgi:hypothetical protein
VNVSQLNVRSEKFNDDDDDYGNDDDNNDDDDDNNNNNIFPFTSRKTSVYTLNLLVNLHFIPKYGSNHRTI